MSTSVITSRIAHRARPSRVAAGLAVGLSMTGVSAFAATAVSPFAADIVFTVQDNHCDPYAPAAVCTWFSSLAGTLELTVSGPASPTTVKTALLDVEGESTDDKHKGEVEVSALEAGASLSLSFAGSYQSLGNPLPAAHPLFAFAPGVVVGPAQGVPHVAPLIQLGTLKSGAFDPYTLGGPLYAFNSTVQVGTWTASVTSAVPEPDRWALTGLGLAVLGLARRRSAPPRAA